MTTADPVDLANLRRGVALEQLLHEAENQPRHTNVVRQLVDLVRELLAGVTAEAALGKLLASIERDPDAEWREERAEYERRARFHQHAVATTTCPTCRAEPGQHCHPIDRPTKRIAGIHASRRDIAPPLDEPDA